MMFSLLNFHWILSGWRRGWSIWSTLRSWRIDIGIHEIIYLLLTDCSVRIWDRFHFWLLLLQQQHHHYLLLRLLIIVTLTWTRLRSRWSGGGGTTSLFLTTAGASGAWYFWISTMTVYWWCRSTSQNVNFWGATYGAFFEHALNAFISDRFWMMMRSSPKKISITCCLSQSLWICSWDRGCSVLRLILTGIISLSWGLGSLKQLVLVVRWILYCVRSIIIDWRTLLHQTSSCRTGNEKWTCLRRWYHLMKHIHCLRIALVSSRTCSETIHQEVMSCRWSICTSYWSLLFLICNSIGFLY